MGEAINRGTFAQRVEQARSRVAGQATHPRREAARPGIAAAEFFETRAADGRLVDPALAIPVMALVGADGRTVRVIGTAFFVGPNIIATAAHVAEEPVKASVDTPQTLCCLEIHPGGKYYWRPVLDRVLHPSSDVALCVVASLQHKQTKSTYPNRIVKLTAEDPAIDEHVFTYAYPDTVFTQNADSNQAARLDLNPQFYDGHIEENHLEKRDAYLMPFPCFRTSIHLHGNASGGPVFNKQGQVFGVNSKSYDGATDLSYVSKVSDLLDLKLPGKFSNTGEDFTLRDLARVGASSVYPSP